MNWYVARGANDLDVEELGVGPRLFQTARDEVDGGVEPGHRPKVHKEGGRQRLAEERALAVEDVVAPADHPPPVTFRLVLTVVTSEYRVLKNSVPRNRSISRLTLPNSMMLFASWAFTPRVVCSSCRIPSKS